MTRTYNYMWHNTDENSSVVFVLKLCFFFSTANNLSDRRNDEEERYEPNRGGIFMFDQYLQPCVSFPFHFTHYFCDANRTNKTIKRIMKATLFYSMANHNKTNQLTLRLAIYVMCQVWISDLLCANDHSFVCWSTDKLLYYEHIS